MNTRKTKSKSKSKIECVRKNLTKRFEKALKTLKNINSKKTRSKRNKSKRSKKNKRGGGFFDLFTSSVPITVNNDRVPLLGRLDGNTYIPAQTGYRSR